MGRTSIQVSDRLADELHRRKDRGDSYEDVVWSLLDDGRERSARTLYIDADDDETVDAVVPAVVATHADRGDSLEIVSITRATDRRLEEDDVEELPAFVFREDEVVERFEGAADVVRHAGDSETYNRLAYDAGHISPEEPRIDTPNPGSSVDRDRLAEALPGSGEVLEARVDAIADMYALLVAEGSAEKSDLLEAIDVEATGYASTASVWSNMVKGRDTLAGCPGVESPSSGMSTWRYTDEVNT